MSWKLILFDFDDTIYLKTTYEFVPNIHDILYNIKAMQIPIGIITYNSKAIHILKSFGLDTCFNFIISIASKYERKSDVLKKSNIWHEITSKKDILFFDNDPYNIYTMKQIGISCFLVNPVNGISRDIIDAILQKDYERISKHMSSTIPHVYNYIERTTMSQNLEQLDKLLLEL